MAANLALGGWFGLTVDELYFWGSAVSVLALCLAAQRAVTRPLIRATPRRSMLPEPIEARVTQALGELDGGTARSLLADVVRTGDALCGRLAGESSAPAMIGRIADLLLASCDAALELAGIEAALETLDKQRGRSTGLPDGWSESLARTEHARDGLVQRLLEALAALGSARGRDAFEEGGLLDRIGSLTLELESERQLQAEAARELEAYLEAASA